MSTDSNIYQSPTFRSLIFSPVSVLLILILVLLAALTNPFVIISVFIIIPVFVIAVKSPLNILIMIVAYISLLASSGWGGRYEFLKIYVSYPIVISLLVLAYFRTLNFQSRTGITQSKTSTLLGIYVIYSLISFVYGILAGNSLNFAGKELMFITFYWSSTITVYAINTKEDIMVFLKSFVIISFLTALGYVTLTLNSANLAEIFLQRIVTQQPHIALFAIPILLSYWLFKASMQDRLVALVFFPTVLIMVIISQQRALWVAIVVVIFSSIFFSYFKSKVNLAVLIRAPVTMLIIICGLILVITILDKLMLGSTLITVATRIESIREAQYDSSLAMRFEEVGRALFDWDSRLLLGTGLGSAINRVAIFQTYDIVDNGFAHIFWKQGLIGITLFLAPFLLSIYYGLVVIIKGSKSESKMVAAALVSGLFGLLIVGITNTSFIMYRFTILWAIFIVILEKNYSFEFKE